MEMEAKDARNEKNMGI